LEFIELVDSILNDRPYLGDVTLNILDALWFLHVLGALVELFADRFGLGDELLS
jgi:hypothetical protein